MRLYIVLNLLITGKVQVVKIGCFCWEGEEVIEWIYCVYISYGQQFEVLELSEQVLWLVRMDVQVCFLIIITESDCLGFRCMRGGYELVDRKYDIYVVLCVKEYYMSKKSGI